MQTKLCLPTWSTEIAQIPLNNGLFAIIDATDFMTLQPYHWTTRRSHSVIYACRKTHIGGKSKTIFMHRQILNAGPDIDVHHLNHNTLDNRRSNLELLNPTLHRLQHTLDRITRKNRADQP
jgi:hypothetical protein